MSGWKLIGTLEDGPKVEAGGWDRPASALVKMTTADGTEIAVWASEVPELVALLTKAVARPTGKTDDS